MQDEANRVKSGSRTMSDAAAAQQPVWQQLVYKQAISTLVPAGEVRRAIRNKDEGVKQRDL
jgi:hypothetical protein